MLKLLKREPDIKIGGSDDPYMLRWYILPRNRWLNVYLHKFLRSDEYRANHDHPWPWLSLILKGAYLEHVQVGDNHTVHLRRAWRPRWGRATDLHRVELRKHPLWPGHEHVWTLFVTGPRRRVWGFQCGSRWVDWRTFLGADAGAETASEHWGPGCG